jgi:hypothetical protein
MMLAVMEMPVAYIGSRVSPILRSAWVNPDTYGVEGIAQRDDPQVPNALGDHQLVRRERRQDQSRDRHAPGGEDQCAEESEDERESQGTTNTGDVPPSPELGGEYRSSAAHAKLKEHHEKEDLIAQSDRANLHLSELANHEGVREVEGSHHEALQRDGQREPPPSAGEMRSVICRCSCRR